MIGRFESSRLMIYEAWSLGPRRVAKLGRSSAGTSMTSYSAYILWTIALGRGIISDSIATGSDLGIDSGLWLRSIYCWLYWNTKPLSGAESWIL
jgi:hypothetical protein